MALTPEQIAAHVDASAATLGLPIPADLRPGVLRYFGLAAGLAELVMQHPLTPEDEAAPVFTPAAVEPRA
jgi:hypothetical protein